MNDNRVDPWTCPSCGRKNGDSADAAEEIRSADICPPCGYRRVRPLHVIAREIHADWSKAKSGIYFGAVPYLDAMGSLSSVDDMYGLDDGHYIVIYFLANANTWRGETARRVKAELKAMTKTK